MSCYTIYYNEGAKMMRPVTSRDEYVQLRDSAKQKAIIADIRNGNDKMKHRLLQMNYSCMPNEDGTLKGSTRMTATVGMDVDHIDKEQMQEVKERILAKKDELGLLMLELSARGEGYHLVFKRKAELSQEDNLRWASDLLGVEYDNGAKDITRVFFTTTASEEDLIYLDDELFRPSPLAPSRKEGGGVVTPVADAPSDSKSNQIMHDSKSNQTMHDSKSNQTMHDSKSNQTPSPSITGEEERSGGEGLREGLYDGVSYAAIIEALENQLGGVPAHGSRNQFIFSMACYLRYICNDDPEWIAQVLPAYGEGREKWMNTIKSACNRSQNKMIPKVLLRALDMARSLNENDNENENIVGYDGSGNGCAPPPMPKKLPPLIKLLISKTPKIYQPAVAHAVFPALATHLWKTRFRYIDNVEHEATLMNVLMAGTGAGKNCIAAPIDCIMKDIRERDAVSLEKERQWKEEMNTKGANKDKKKRPEGIVIQEVDADMTNAAFVLRLSEAEEHFLYVRMNEIDQFDALKTSARNRSQFQIMCLAFDPDNSYGQTRVGSQSVSARVCIRFNWNASTTIQKGQQYFRSVLTDGPISRINFCTIPEQPIGAEMPIYGTYDAEFESQLKPYIDRLNAARGLIECPKATALAKKLKEENAEFARLSQSRTYENLSFRANVIAFLKAMVLYVAQGEQWDKTLEDFVRWSEQYDLWCKMRFFGEAIDDANGDTKPHKRGPKNLLEELPDRFTLEEAVAVRRKQSLPAENTSSMLSNWKSRGYIAEDPEGQPNIWVKTLFPPLSR
ncbi:MAG: VirE protein [Prevotellaceae bacterium]|nr:VirE protein [Candidatus Minthosoma equi]